MPALPPINPGFMPRSAPTPAFSSRNSTPSFTPHPPSSQAYFAPSSFKHHPLFMTSALTSYGARAAPTPFGGSDAHFTGSGSSSLHLTNPNLKVFTKTFDGSGNYNDTGLGSVKRKEELHAKAKQRKQRALVERAKMKASLLQLDELKRQRRYKLRELKRRQGVLEEHAAGTIQRYYRGHLTRHNLAIAKHLRETLAVNQIIRAYRTYCLVRIAKADRGVLTKLKAEDRGSRIIQRAILLFTLRRQAVKRIQEMRARRANERREFLRELRYKAACYIQRIFRGILDRNLVVKKAVENQVRAAQERLDLMDEAMGGEKNKIEVGEARRNRYDLKGKSKGGVKSE